MSILPGTIERPCTGQGLSWGGNRAIQRSVAGAEAGSGPGGQRFRLRVAEDRRRYPKAWTAWSPDDDSRLLDGYRSGMDIGQLAAELGRKPRAIVSRLVKHGVVANAET
jgi:hypothetical protein